MAADGSMTPGFSFALDAARDVFPGVKPGRLVLALLATIRPVPEWNGCRIFVDDQYANDDDTIGVQVDGRAAASVREHLATAFRNAGIPVHEAMVDLAAGSDEALAEARDGRWIE